jgi:hypothetical protein
MFRLTLMWGSILSRMRTAVSVRFWGKVDIRGEDECWPWLGGLKHGYGRIQYLGVRWEAHRLAWTLTYGPIPKGLFVCHHCDNPPCCNPKHLWRGTHADNMADRNAKGRQAHLAGEKNPNFGKHPPGMPGEKNPMFGKTGEKNPNSKLTWDQVSQIRLRKDLTYAELRKRFDLSKRMIWLIRTGRAWKHV